MLSSMRRITSARALMSILFIATALILAGYAYKRVTRGKPAQVDIAIRSGKSETAINKANPFMGAVIYGSQTVDVNKIDPASITLGGAAVRRRGDGTAKVGIRDINGDGVADLSFGVWTDSLKLSEGAHVLALEARTFDGRAVVGQHSVEVVNEPLHEVESVQANTQSVKNSEQGGTVKGNKKDAPNEITAGASFTNAAPIVINDGGNPVAATPYPSSITVSMPGVTNTSRVSVRINGLTHTSTDDIDMLLVGPTLAKLVIQSDVGGNNGVTNFTYTIADAATPCMPDSTTLSAATAYKPTRGNSGSVDNYLTCLLCAAGTPPPPAGPYPMPTPCPSATNLTSTFGTLDPNGAWRLYIQDDVSGDSGTISGGWTITIIPGGPSAAKVSLSGTINTPDGVALAGTSVKLDGATSARTITDSNGHYTFTDLDADNFYAVTPSRANYSFSPASLSFSLNSDKTDAAFMANPTGVVANPLDTDLFFVRQQYVDFLNREPDMGGLNYWADQIGLCGTDALCLNNRRTDVSAAFFMEREFQLTGSFVYGLYKGSLGRNPQFAEFMPDRSKIGVGSQLDSSKQALADEWVARAEFRAQYPDSMSNTDFVNKLFDTAGLSGYSAERQSYIQALNSGSTRSSVVRGVIESDAFTKKEYNQAFVVTQYFSYLRRDPDEAGLAFWINVLNNKEPNNYKGMVCSFVTSAEYQKRFSSVVSHNNSECGQ